MHLKSGDCNAMGAWQCIILALFSHVLGKKVNDRHSTHPRQPTSWCPEKGAHEDMTSCAIIGGRVKGQQGRMGQWGWSKS